ncbi:MAG: response regulator transcription factor [Pseudomonadota bacterium]
MMTPIRVMLVDDHAVVRAGYQFLLENVEDVVVVAEASSGEEAVKRFPEVMPDVLVMDLSMPGIGGIEAIRQVLELHGDAKILVFSMHENSTFVDHALQAGVSGYISKNSSPDVLLTAIRKLASGHVYIDSELAQSLVIQKSKDKGSLLSSLSTRELQILCMFAEAQSIEAIAAALSLSMKTIANYITQIKEKLQVSTGPELVRLAISQGLVTI